jgi:fatty acid synthase subunit beta
LLYFKDRTVFSSIRTTGKVTIELPTKEIRTIASVDYNQDVSHGNPVMEYLKRFGHSTEEIVLFDKPIPLHNSNPICFRASESNQIYAQISADFNPIHVSRIFSACAGLPGTITHGMHTSATVHSIVETHAADGKPGRVLSYKANFTGMVLPGDEIEVYLWHTGMLAGRKVIKIEARNSKGHAVLTGEAEVEQPTTAYIFTGQGSQEVNMGMELAAKSPVAKEVWDRADKFLLENYGTSMMNWPKNF